MPSKTYTLAKAIQERKEVLFGNGDSKSQHTVKEREEAWEAVRLYMITNGFPNFEKKTWRDVRNHDWQYLRRSAAAKLEHNQKSINDPIQYSEVDKIVFDIMGNEKKFDDGEDDEDHSTPSTSEAARSSGTSATPKVGLNVGASGKPNQTSNLDQFLLAMMTNNVSALANAVEPSAGSAMVTVDGSAKSTVEPLAMVKTATECRKRANIANVISHIRSGQNNVGGDGQVPVKRRREQPQPVHDTPVYWTAPAANSVTAAHLASTALSEPNDTANTQKAILGILEKQTETLSSIDSTQKTLDSTQKAILGILEKQTETLSSIDSTLKTLDSTLKTLDSTNRRILTVLEASESRKPDGADEK